MLPIHGWKICAVALTVALVSGAGAQQAPRNLVANPSFESSFRRENPWDGVNQQGFLEGQRGSLPVLTQAGTIGETSMPVSVSMADMNGNGLLDIVAADVLGYMRIYFNSGDKQNPKFTQGELISVFLTRVRSAGQEGYRFRGPRITMANLSGSGGPDMVIGNYIGEVMVLRNQGSGQRPDFRQPPDVTRIIVPTSGGEGRRWGNVFAPAVWDFTGDGRYDLLLGEGSYSANNVHLLLNQATNQSPRFSEDRRYVLAFGDGREQLTPTVVDYNGSGKPDLLVADRSGKIGVYLDNGNGWNPGDELEFASYVPIGGDSNREMSFGGICTVTTGDLNGNGLFDLVVGKTNGRIAVAFNTGTREEPKFEAPVELRGESLLPPLQLPSGWEVDYGLNKGNFLGYATVVDEKEDPNLAPPDGTKALKFGYFPNFNKVLGAPGTYLPAIGNQDLREPNWNLANLGPANYFMLRQEGRLRFEVGKTYTVSFRVKGSGVSNAVARVTYRGHRRLGEDRVERLQRGAARVVRNEVTESNDETFSFSPSANWTTVSRDVRINFSERELRELKQTTSASIIIGFQLQPGQGQLYFDDFKIIERP